MRYLIFLALAACNAPLEDVADLVPGPTGPRGARGPAGVSCAPPTTYVVRATGSAGSIVAQCEEGDALTGGHCQAVPGADLVESGPVDTTEIVGWWCFVDGEPIGEVLGFAYAICLER